MNYTDRFLRETASYSVLDVMLADIAVRIQLAPSDYQKAVDHYEAINEWIDREDSVLHGRVQLLYPQGGFMIGATTARHDTETDFDIDVMAQIDWPMNVDPETALSTLDKAIRGEPGSRYYKKAERKTRCSTVHYDGMHLDVTPAVLLPGLAEKISFIFHSKPSDPTVPKQTLYANPFGFGQWFNRLDARRRDLRSVLREIVAGLRPHAARSAGEIRRRSGSTADAGVPQVPRGHRAAAHQALAQPRLRPATRTAAHATVGFAGLRRRQQRQPDANAG